MVAAGLDGRWSIPNQMASPAGHDYGPLVWVTRPQPPPRLVVVLRALLVLRGAGGRVTLEVPAVVPRFIRLRPSPVVVARLARDPRPRVRIIAAARDESGDRTVVRAVVEIPKPGVAAV
jgi:hypothetical protein